MYLPEILIDMKHKVQKLPLLAITVALLAVTFDTFQRIYYPNTNLSVALLQSTVFLLVIFVTLSICKNRIGIGKKIEEKNQKHVHHKNNH